MRNLTAATDDSLSSPSSSLTGDPVYDCCSQSNNFCLALVNMVQRRCALLTLRKIYDETFSSIAPLLRCDSINTDGSCPGPQRSFQLSHNKQRCERCEHNSYTLYESRIARRMTLYSFVICVLGSMKSSMMDSTCVFQLSGCCLSHFGGTLDQDTTTALKWFVKLKPCS